MEDPYSDENGPNTDLMKERFNIVNWIILSPDRNSRVSGYREGHMSLEFTEGGVLFNICGSVHHAL